MKKHILFFILMILPVSSFAASDVYLKIDGVDGESSGSIEQQLVAQPVPEKPVACTMDAKACPDGSYVGRTGPNCEFAPCPEVSTRVAPPPAPKPAPSPSGDPDFDLLKTAPPPALKPAPTPSGDPDFDLLKTTPPPSPSSDPRDEDCDDASGKIVGSEECDDRNDDDCDGVAKGSTGDPDCDFRDDDDDGDMVPTILEDIDMSVSKVEVRGWDPKKKEEFMNERKEAAEIHSKQELEHFAQGVLLDDEQIEEVQFNPKEISVRYATEGKLLWLIPVSYNEELVARSEKENDQVIFEVKKPWWGFLVDEDDDDDGALSEAEKKHKETIEISSWSWGVSNQAMLLKTISNVLKTKHDTAKNSVGNIR